MQDDLGHEVLAAAHRDHHRQRVIDERRVVMLAQAEPDDAPRP
jgi:hypothetical protein